NEEATQEEVQSALRDLRLAEIALEKVEEPKEVDKSELEQAVDSAKKRVEANYTIESWKPFIAALQEAIKILADEKATQGDIQNILNNLLATENNLVEKDTTGEDHNESAGDGNSGEELLPSDNEDKGDTETSNDGNLPKTGEDSSV